MHPIRFASIIVLLCALGCGGARPTTAMEPPGSEAAAAHAGEVTGPGAGPAQTDCSGWRTWTEINRERFQSHGHGGKWVDVYVEPQFADAYRARSASAPVGMRVVKAGYQDAGGTQFLALTVMGKMPPGYDPAHGDWYYGVLDATGHTAKMQGKIEMCIHCHEQAKAHDYLYGADGR